MLEIIQTVAFITLVVSLAFIVLLTGCFGIFAEYDKRKKHKGGER